MLKIPLGLIVKRSETGNISLENWQFVNKPILNKINSKNNSSNIIFESIYAIKTEHKAKEIL